MEFLNWINNIDLQAIPQLLLCYFGVIILTKDKLNNLKLKNCFFIIFSSFLILFIRHRLESLKIPMITLLTIIFSMFFIKNNLVKSVNITSILILLLTFLDNLLDSDYRLYLAFDKYNFF